MKRRAPGKPHKGWKAAARKMLEANRTDHLSGWRPYTKFYFKLEPQWATLFNSFRAQIPTENTTARKD